MTGLTHVSLLMMVIGTFGLVFVFSKLDLDIKKSSLCSLACVPCLYYCTYFLVDVATADEQSYMPYFANMTSIDYNTVFGMKTCYQYRTTQMILGLFFRIIGFVFPKLTGNPQIVLFKASHWMMYMLLIYVILYVWGRYIYKDILKNTPRVYTIVIVATFYCLAGLPVTCLMLKVSNYDSGNVYFAVLAFSLLIAADKLEDLRLAFCGGVIITFGCLEKLACLVYYITVLSLIAFLVYRHSTKRKIFYSVISIIVLMLTSIIISAINLVFLRTLSGLNFDNISYGMVFFPFVYLIRVFLGNDEFDLSDIHFYDDNILLYLSVEFGIILLIFAVLIFFDYINRNTFMHKKPVASYGVSFLSIWLIVSGILGTSLIHRWVYPWIDFPNGVYQPPGLFNCSSYFYGAKSFLGHQFLNFVFSNAVVVSNFPTVILFALLIASVIISSKNNNETIIKSLWIACIMFIPLFSLFGEPPCNRYYGVTIIMLSLLSFYYISTYSIIIYKLKTLLILSVLLLYCVELHANLPLYASFSPLWNYRSQEYKNNVRQGGWNAAEAMTWGENVVLAAREITKDVEANGKQFDEVTIVSNYGTNWYTNPGYTIVYYDSWLIGEDHDFENTYFAFAKFKLCRSDIPEFIVEVEPLYRVKICGETTVWVYRGDQIKEYF